MANIDATIGAAALDPSQNICLELEGHQRGKCLDIPRASSEVRSDVMVDIHKVERLRRNIREAPAIPVEVRRPLGAQLSQIRPHGIVLVAWPRIVIGEAARAGRVADVGGDHLGAVRHGAADSGDPGTGSGSKVKSHVRVIVEGFHLRWPLRQKLGGVLPVIGQA